MLIGVRCQCISIRDRRRFHSTILLWKQEEMMFVLQVASSVLCSDNKEFSSEREYYVSRDNVL